MKTINRGQLKKLAAKGQLIAKCNYHLTDDYRFDEGNNFGETGWLPVQLITDNSQFVEGMMNLRDSDFRSKSGCAYEDDRGLINLVVHSNKTYTLKKVDDHGYTN